MKPEEPFCQILIADRNPHVRTYLKRELLARGYRVLLARACQEVIAEIEGVRRVDILILDPDLPGADAGGLFQKLKAYLPKIPVILHTLEHRRKEDFDLQPGWLLVEKKADSVEQLQAALHKVLHGSQPPVPAQGRDCKVS